MQMGLGLAQAAGFGAFVVLIAALFSSCSSWRARCV